MDDTQEEIDHVIFIQNLQMYMSKFLPKKVASNGQKISMAYHKGRMLRHYPGGNIEHAKVFIESLESWLTTLDGINSHK